VAADAAPRRARERHLTFPLLMRTDAPTAKPPPMLEAAADIGGVLVVRVSSDGSHRAAASSGRGWKASCRIRASCSSPAVLIDRGARPVIYVPLRSDDWTPGWHHCTARHRANLSRVPGARGFPKRSGRYQRTRNRRAV